MHPIKILNVKGVCFSKYELLLDALVGWPLELTLTNQCFNNNSNTLFFLLCLPFIIFECA